ncbi:MAG: MFS transporter [Rhodospirillales bacterium]|nr:MFS transporter [Rhodospirillales bacterium]
MPNTANHRFRRIVWPFAGAEIIVWAAFYYSFPALLPEWERALGWSKTELAGAFTAALILSALSAPIAGRLIDKGLARLVFTGSTLLGAVLLFSLSFVSELWQFYAIWLGMGIAMAGALYEACFAIVTRTVGARNKQAITLITLVAGLAGTISFPTAHSLVLIIGWQGAVQVFAGAVLIIAVPLSWYGCRHADAYEKNLEPPIKTTVLPVGRPTRSLVFWLLAVAFAAIAIEHGAVLTHLLFILDDRGINPETAVFAASMIGPMQVAGRLAMMAAERHVSMFTIAIGCFLTIGLAAACLLGSNGITGLVVAFVILHGAGYGVTSIMRPVITAEFLGKQNFGAVSGMLAVPFMLGFAIAPTLAALIWKSGGYDLVLQLAMLVAAFGAVALVCAGRLVKRA